MPDSDEDKKKQSEEIIREVVSQMKWKMENRKPEHVDRVADLLGRIRKQYPQLRIGQIIAGSVPSDADIFNVWDEHLIECLEKFIGQPSTEGCENCRAEHIDRFADLLREIRQQFPQGRMGQIISIALRTGEDLPNMGDEKLIDCLECELERISQETRGE